MIKVACLLMVKNEEKSIIITLESIKNLDGVIIFDTGSSDNTIELIKDFCTKNKLKLNLKQGEFVNFSVSRNELLSYADKINKYDYYLLLDANDELRGDLKKQLESQKELCDIYNMSQLWKIGKDNVLRYYNSRLIKSNKEFIYRGAVHEYIETKPEHIGGKLSDNISIFQDRTKNCINSRERWKKDRILLQNEYKKNPKDNRTLFYLAQTYSCLNMKKEAYKFYKLRAENTEIGFYEEKYHSLYKCGEISEDLKYSWKESLNWYLKAFEYIQRVEPLIKIAEYYKQKNIFLLSYTFIKLACDLPYLDNLLLFVDKQAYDYKRWYLLGIVAYYVDKYKEGYDACLKALESGIDVNLNTKNLSFYQKKLKDVEFLEK